MSLQKGFLRGPQLKPDGWLIFSGALLSAVITFAFYFFFLYFAEALRKALSDILFTILLMEERDVKFHGYSLALLSSVIGQSFGLRLIFQNIKRPADAKSRLNPRLSLHIVDTTLWYWLYWCTKLLFVLGIFFTAISLQYDLNIREDIGYVFFLFSFVWFLNNWLGAYRILRKNYFKWLFCAFLYLILSSVVFGNVRLIDHNTLNQYIKRSYPEYRYEMQLAESRTQIGLRRFRPNTKVHLIWNGIEAKVLFRKSDLPPLRINDPLVHKKVNQIRSSLAEVEQDYLRFIIAADTRIPTSSILAFEHVLSTNGVDKVLYRTSVKNSKYPWHFPLFQRTGFPKLISPECLVAQQTLYDFKRAGHKANQIEWPDVGCYRLISFLQENRVLVKNDSSGLRLNGTPVGEQELLNILANLIDKYEGDLNVLYQPHPDVSFAEYLKGRDIIYQSYIANRKKYALDKYGLEYEYADRYWDPRLRDQYRDIRWTYPIAILELTGWNLEFYNYLKE
ncbi:MAG: hypothetical protein HEP71_17875 [Roseivirga sp.]|nr:hypothetical protein [Roseivirga sp.]